MKGLRIALGLILISAVSFTSCLKKKYEGPPDTSSYDPKLPVNATIGKLLSLLPVNYPSTSVSPVLIDSDWTVAATVIGDDRSGNLYKQIVVDDGATGVALLLDAYSLYNDYPAGRKIYIKLKGLSIGTYHSLPQLGYTPDNTGAISGIPSTLIGNFIVKANYPNEIKVTKITLADIAGANVQLENRLVQIDNVEFDAASTQVPYAAPAPSTGTSLNISDCSGSIVLRSSGYANFQPALTPTGKGTITAIYTVYNSGSQLVLRDTSDVQMHDPNRCDGVVFVDPSKIIFKEDFQSVTLNGTVLSLPGWVNFTEAGSVQYKGGILGSTTKFTKISAFSTGEADVKSWLITPAINLSGATNPVFSFKSNDGYDNGASLKVYISTNYSGSGDPTTATWTELTGLTVSSGHASGYGSQFISSGTKSINGYTGNVYIAFKYVGADPSLSTTFEIDDVMVSKD